MAKLNKNIVYYSNMHLLLDQSPSSAASVVLFRPKIPSFGKFCKKDFFGTSLFSVAIILVQHYRVFTHKNFHVCVESEQKFQEN